VSTLNLKIPQPGAQNKDTRHLISLICSQWLSLSTCVIQTVIDIVPAPAVAQASRIPKMLYPDLYEQTIKPKNKLEEDLYSSNWASDACVSAYVSKMFAISRKDLPENKKRPLTADDMRSRAREARFATEGTQNLQSPSLSSSVVEHIPEQLASDETKNNPEEPEILLGFARLYSGTIRVGTRVHCVLPKYKSSLGPVHPQNSKYIVTALVEGLYVMMGRELVPVDSVRAGNTFAIKGLDGKVGRSATLCAPGETGTGDNADITSQKDCLINLGGVNRSVCTHTPVVADTADFQ
jgi:ribosome assembly protein 1